MKRNRLDEISTRARHSAEEMHSHVGVRRTIEERVAKIRAKYKKS